MILHIVLLTSFQNVNRIRVPYPFQWGSPTFDAGESFAMMAASFAALIEVCCEFLPLIFSLALANLIW